MSLDIKVYDDKKKDMMNPKACCDINLKHPFSVAIFGCTGSGKTQLLLNLLLNPLLFKVYFDQIYLISATGKSDESFSHLKLNKNRVITEDLEENVETILTTIEKDIEKNGYNEKNKRLIIYEDLTSNKKLMNSKQFLKSFVQNRHLNLSTIAVCHKYNSLLRTARLNSNHIFIFPCSLSEQIILCNEYCNVNQSKQEFNKMVGDAWEPDKENKKPFLWINNKETDKTKKFRKNLNYYLN